MPAGHSAGVVLDREVDVSRGDWLLAVDGQGQSLEASREIRATVENRDLAETSGISTNFVDVLTFFIGSGIAGLAGVALSLMDAISFDFGVGYIVASGARAASRSMGTENSAASICRAIASISA